MPEITSLFWDVGGVILTNGWDHNSRMEAAQAFGLDWEEFRERHDLSMPAFDSGQITLNQYLDRTLFYRARNFTREDFTAFMFAQSKEYPETRAVLDDLCRLHPALRDRILDEQGEVRQHINIFVGEECIRFADGLATAVPEGAEILIVPAVSGG